MRWPFVAGEVVHHHHVAGPYPGHQHLLSNASDISRVIAGSTMVEHHTTCWPSAASSVAVFQWPWGTLSISAHQRPAPQARHVGLGLGLDDQDHPARIEPKLLHLPGDAGIGNVGAVLLHWRGSVFYMTASAQASPRRSPRV